MKAGIYLRVSTIEQKKYGISVDNQLEALTEYCKANGHELVSIYNDAGKTAHAPYNTRPALLKMIQDCQNKKIEILLFTRLDRFFRSVPDYYACIEQMNNVPWKAIWEDYETVTSAGRFKVNIMLSIAQAEAEADSDRTKAAIEYKRKRGDYVGKAPLGYVIKDRQLIKDENTKDAIQAIFDCYLETFSSKRACEVAKEHGLPLERQHIIKLLHRTAYYGDASGYNCEPYITKEQWQLIQDNMQKYTRSPSSQNRSYIFSGLCVCGYCGQRMSGHATKRTHSTGNIIYYTSYRCAGSNGSKRICPNLQIQEKHIENYLLDSLEALLRDVNYSHGEILDEDDISAKIKRKKALQSKLKRLATLFADGDIELSEYRKQRDSIKEEIESIFIDQRTLPELPPEWKDIYKDLDAEHKQGFWKKIIDQIVITNETKAQPFIIFRD